MPYAFVETPEGLFGIDVDLVGRILDDYAYASALNRNARPTSISQKGINPFSWGLPDLHTVDVDWEAIRSERENNRAQLEYQYQSEINQHLLNAQSRSTSTLTRPLSEIRDELYGLQQDAYQAKQSFRTKQMLAQRKTSAGIQESVDRYEGCKLAAEFTRDLSATTLMVGGSVLSGGAAVAAVGLGSTVKATGKWAETGKVEAGLMELAVSFTVGIIPGSGATKAQSMALMVTKTKLEIVGGSVVSLVSGDSEDFATALGKATVDKALEAAVGAVVPVDGIFRIPEVKKALKKATLTGDLSMKSFGQLGLTAGKASVDTMHAMGRKKVVDAMFAKSKPKPVLSSTVLVGEPTIADAAIIGPDRSSQPRLIPTLRRNALLSRRSPGITGF